MLIQAFVSVVIQSMYTFSHYHHYEEFSFLSFYICIFRSFVSLNFNKNRIFFTFVRFLLQIFCKFTGLSYFETTNHKSSDRSFPDGLGWLSSPSPSLVSLLTVIPDALLHRGYPSHWICSSLESIYDMILRELLRPDFLVKSSSSSARSRAEAQRTFSADEKKKSRMSSSYETNLPYPRFSSGLSHYFLEMISLGSVSSLLGSHYLSIPYQNQKIYPAQYDPLFESMIVHSPLSPLPWLRGLLFLPSVDQSAICACLRSTRIGKVHFSLDRQILSQFVVP